MEFCKRSSGTHIKQDIPIFESGLASINVEQLRTKILKHNSNKHKSIELWTKNIKTLGNFGRHYPRATSTKIHAACMYGSVPHAMAQLVLKVEKLSRIIGTAPVLWCSVTVYVPDYGSWSILGDYMLACVLP